MWCSVPPQYYASLRVDAAAGQRDGITGAGDGHEPVGESDARAWTTAGTSSQTMGGTATPGTRSRTKA
jgi:hypothetical protein